MKKIINPWVDSEKYNCICCSPNNPKGLHLKFWEDGDEIVTKWDPTGDYQGWVNILHGGIQALLMDEVGGWVVCRKLQTTGVTSKMDIQYIKPVTTNDKLTIKGHLTRQMRNIAFIDTWIENEEGETLTKAILTYYCASQQKAITEMGFTGCKVEGE